MRCASVDVGQALGSPPCCQVCAEASCFIPDVGRGRSSARGLPSRASRRLPGPASGVATLAGRGQLPLLHEAVHEPHVQLAPRLVLPQEIGAAVAVEVGGVRGSATRCPSGAGCQVGPRPPPCRRGSRRRGPRRHVVPEHVGVAVARSARDRQCWRSSPPGSGGGSRRRGTRLYIRRWRSVPHEAVRLGRAPGRSREVEGRRWRARRLDVVAAAGSRSEGGLEVVGPGRSRWSARRPMGARLSRRVVAVRRLQARRSFDSSCAARSISRRRGGAPRRDPVRGLELVDGARAAERHPAVRRVGGSTARSRPRTRSTLREPTIGSQARSKGRCRVRSPNALVVW